MKAHTTAEAANLDEAPSTIPQLSYWQVFIRFLRFGFLAWGGPVAQIAMIRRELVEEEHWVSSSRFNRILAIYQNASGAGGTRTVLVFLGRFPRAGLAASSRV